jgi:hypothetical protein
LSKDGLLLTNLRVVPVSGAYLNTLHILGMERPAYNNFAKNRNGGGHRGRIAKIAKPTIEISDKVRLNLEKFV